VIALGIEGLGPGTLIGGGGSAVVFSALRLSDDLAVAVKVLRLTAADPRTRKQFDREAEAIARLGEHKGIISILSSGITDRGEPYLVMPLMKTSLQQKLEEFGPAPWQEAGSILIDVCDAVEFAHRRNVLHRDIKPANILVNKNGNPVVADFGIAKFVDGTQTMSTLVAATPGFAPPERLRGLAASERSDVYSLAAMFYALVAGSGPFEEPDMQVEAMMRHVLESEPTPLIDLVPDIPKLLSRTVAEALHKDPIGGLIPHRRSLRLFAPHLAKNMTTRRPARSDSRNSQPLMRRRDRRFSNSPLVGTPRRLTWHSRRNPSETAVGNGLRSWLRALSLCLLLGFGHCCRFSTNPRIQESPPNQTSPRSR